MMAAGLADLYRTPLVLESEHVRLEPLTVSHASDLFSVARDEDIWRWLSSAPPNDIGEMRGWIAGLLAAQSGGFELPFAVVDKRTGRAIGSTRYLAIVPIHQQLEIGGTWSGRAHWRTAVNTECKYILLRHAFESLGCVRVQFMTDLRNERSQRAIERLGAKREGVMRKFRIIAKDGYHRSNVCYSIIDDEWPEVKTRLETMLRREPVPAAQALDHT
jgi:RimJ/RimL family protein N-acetyltransferase